MTFDKALSSGYYYLAEKNVSSDYTKFGQDYAGDGYKTDFVSNGDTNTLLTKTINGYDAIRVEISADTVITDTRQVELTALTINAAGKVVLGKTVVGSTELKVAAGEYPLNQINQVIDYK